MPAINPVPELTASVVLVVEVLVIVLEVVVVVVLGVVPPLPFPLPFDANAGVGRNATDASTDTAPMQVATSLRLRTEGIQTSGQIEWIA